MNYAATQINQARQIARIAEKQINVQTGLRMKIMLYPGEDKKRPEEMLHIIAKTLGMVDDCYTLRSRRRDIVDARFISTLLLRRFYPKVTLKQIAAFYGGQDHTSIMNAITRGSNLLETHDIVFTKKYNQALNAVLIWLKD
jgi:chromosomal replication initiation ATPase DnaA